MTQIQRFHNMVKGGTPLRAARNLNSHAHTHPIFTHPVMELYATRMGIKDTITPVKYVMGFLRWLPHMELEDITPEMVDRALRAALYNNLHLEYVKRLLKYLKRFVRFAKVRDVAFKFPHLLERLEELRYTAEDSSVISTPVVLLREVVDTFTKYIYENGTDEDVVLWECLKSGARLSEPLFLRIKGVVFDDANGAIVFYLGTKTRPRMVRQPKRAIPAIMRLMEGKSPEDLLLQMSVNHKWYNPLDMDTRHKFWDTRTNFARKRLYDLQRQCFGEVKFRPKELRSTFISSAVSTKPESLPLVAAHCGNSELTILRYYLKPIGDPLAEIIDGSMGYVPAQKGAWN